MINHPNRSRRKLDIRLTKQQHDAYVAALSIAISSARGPEAAVLENLSNLLRNVWIAARPIPRR